MVILFLERNVREAISLENSGNIYVYYVLIILKKSVYVSVCIIFSNKIKKCGIMPN